MKELWVMNKELTYQDIAKDIFKLKKDVVEWEKDFFAEIKRKEELRLKLAAFNPDTHVIVSKEQLDITNQIKQLTGLVSTVEQVAKKVNEGNAVQADMANKINEVHAVQTGLMFKPKASTRLTAKQKKQAEADALEAELQALWANSHRRLAQGR